MHLEIRDEDDNTTVLKGVRRISLNLVEVACIWVDEFWEEATIRVKGRYAIQGEPQGTLTGCYIRVVPLEPDPDKAYDLAREEQDNDY